MGPERPRDDQVGFADELRLRGNYSGANSIIFGANQIVEIDRLTLLSGGSLNSVFSYDITLNNNNVLPGTSFIVSASSLNAAETLTFNASAETDTPLTIIGGAGNDVIVGGARNDTITSGGGQNRITGGRGADGMNVSNNDTTNYLTIADSTPTSQGRIAAFQVGSKIDLSAIDIDPVTPGVQHFTFTDANTPLAPGQLRIFGAGFNDYEVEGDINGDGTPEFSIRVGSSNHRLNVDDFIGVNASSPVAMALGESSGLHAADPAPGASSDVMQVIDSHLLIPRVPADVLSAPDRGEAVLQSLASPDNAAHALTDAVPIFSTDPLADPSSALGGHIEYIKYVMDVPVSVVGGHSAAAPSWASPLD